MSAYTPDTSDTPPHGIDPNATRYLSPRQVYNTGDPTAATAGARASIPEGGQAQRPDGPYQSTYTGQPYPPTPPAYASRPMNGASINQRYRERTILGLILIGGGLLFLLQQFALFQNIGDLIPLLIGGLFMYAYFNTRAAYRIGFLIPGAILTGLGVGIVLNNFPRLLWGTGDLTTLTLGLGFCLIWLLERKHWWSLIPGGILIVSGISEAWVFSRLWPLVLIALGAYLLYDQFRRKQNMQ